MIQQTLAEIENLLNKDLWRAVHDLNRFLNVYEKILSKTDTDLFTSNFFQSYRNACFEFYSGRLPESDFNTIQHDIKSWCIGAIEHLSSDSTVIALEKETLRQEMVRRQEAEERQRQEVAAIQKKQTIHTNIQQLKSLYPSNKVVFGDLDRITYDRLAYDRLAEEQSAKIIHSLNDPQPRKTESEAHNEQFFMSASPSLSQKIKGLLFFQIPLEMTFKKVSKCVVRIQYGQLLAVLFPDGIPKNTWSQKAIKLCALMSVSIYETVYDNTPNFKIIPLNSLEQLVEPDEQDFTEWGFDVMPLQAGVHCLMLRVTRKEFNEVYDTILSKDELSYSQEIKIITNAEVLHPNSETNFVLLEKLNWTEGFVFKLRELIAQDEIGRVLVQLSNFCHQKVSCLVFINDITQLQSNWHFGKNAFEKGITLFGDWKLTNAQTTFATLSLIDAIDTQMRIEIDVYINVSKIPSQSSAQ